MSKFRQFYRINEHTDKPPKDKTFILCQEGYIDHEEYGKERVIEWIGLARWNNHLNVFMVRASPFKDHNGAVTLEKLDERHTWSIWPGKYKW